MTMRDIACLGPNGTLGADDHQWILCREGKAISFVRSTKAVLARCIREKGIELSPEGKAALDAQADDFNSRRADPARRGTPIAPGALIAAPAAPIEPRIGPKVRSKSTMIERLGPNCAIGTDGLQWIVFKAVSDPSLRTWQDRQWRAAGFIHSSKRALACIEAKGLELTPAGLPEYRSLDGGRAEARDDDSATRRQRAEILLHGALHCTSSGHRLMRISY
jgi:hypothetical protein